VLGEKSYSLGTIEKRSAEQPQIIFI